MPSKIAKSTSALPSSSSRVEPLYADASVEVPLTVTNLTVGITAVANDNIRVFGLNGNVTIDLTNSIAENASYELISLNGQRVATGALVAGNINTLPNVNTGIYAVRIIHAEGIFTSKVLVN